MCVGVGRKPIVTNLEFSHSLHPPTGENSRLIPALFLFRLCPGTGEPFSKIIGSKFPQSFHHWELRNLGTDSLYTL